MKIRVSAPGKLLLLGDHAVVYGYPCLVSAVEKRLYVEAEIIDCTEDVIHAPQVKESRFVLESIAYFKKKFKLNKSVKIVTKGDFSHNVGLGSSSAVTVATFKALSLIFQIPLSKKDIFDLSYLVNYKIQGLGSGFDIAAATFGETLYFVTKGKVIEPLHISPIPLVVGYSGQKADTPYFVRKVAESFRTRKKEMESIFTKISQLVEASKKNLILKEYVNLGQHMNQNHELLQKLGVSTPKLDTMVEAAIKAGALGAKLSGAGGGDCMIALVADDKRTDVKEAIRNAGGEIIKVTNNAQGVRIEDDPNELFVVVNTEDEVIGYKSRRECHSDKNLVHRATGILITNKKGQILLQKRSMSKDTSPGKYTFSASGHVGKGETYEEAAKRELWEELGVKSPLSLKHIFLAKLKNESEMEALFTTRYDGPFKINTDEVESVNFFSKREILGMLDKLSSYAILCLKKLGII